MKYSGSDFKFTSQANHLAKLLTLKTENHRENIHAQRLYNRHKIVKGTGHVMSNWHILNQSALDNTTNKGAIASGLPVQPIIVPTEKDIEWDPIQDEEGQVSTWEPING